MKRLTLALLAALTLVFTVPVVPGNAVMFVGSYVISASGPSTLSAQPGLGAAVSMLPYGNIAAWNATANGDSDDAVYNSLTNNVFDSTSSTTVRSQLLEEYNYNFDAIAGSATINGVEVTINMYDSGAGNSGVVLDYIKLLDTSRAPAGSNYSSNRTYIAATTSSTYTFGGPTSTWDCSLTPTWIKDADFGLALGFKSVTNNADVFVDYVRVKIYYTVP